MVDLPNDVLAIVDKFRNATGSLPTARTDMSGEGNGVDYLVFVADFTAVLDGFQGGSFRFAGPVPCSTTPETNPKNHPTIESGRR